MLLNYLIVFLLAATSLSVDGWFPVEKTQKYQSEAEENDSSIWVLFSKSVGEEKFTIRFPEDPTYRYVGTGALEIEAADCQLIVQKTVSGLAEVGDRLSFVEGKWLHEHFVQTEHHLYHFKTLSDFPESPEHTAFVSSFSIERNG